MYEKNKFIMKLINFIKLNTVGSKIGDKAYLYEYKFYKSWIWYLLMPAAITLSVYLAIYFYGIKTNLDLVGFFIIPLFTHIYLFKKCAVLKEKEVVIKNRENFAIIFLYTTLVPLIVLFVLMYIFFIAK